MYTFRTSLWQYSLYKTTMGWTTAWEVCRGQGLNLAVWPSSAELYAIFAGGWQVSYAKEFWVGAVRPSNTSVYTFVDGASVPTIEGLALDDYVVVAEPECIASLRGCCLSLTDRMLGPYLAYATERAPRLMVHDCLLRRQFLCRGPLPSASPPPSPPVRPLAAAVQIRFNMDFVALSINVATLNAFKAGVSSRVAKEYGLAPSQARVYDLRQEVTGSGATAVKLLIALPQAITGDSAQNYLFRLLASPSVLFETAFRKDFSISTPIMASLDGVVAIDGAPPPAGAEELGTGSDASGIKDTSHAALIAGIVAGFGSASVIGGICAYLVLKRRRASKLEYEEVH